MQRLRPSPAVSSSSDRNSAAPVLRLVDEAQRTSAPAKPRPAVPRWDSLSGPMPLAGLPLPPPLAPVPQVDEFFEMDYLPPRQADPGAKSRELPRFVPLSPDGAVGQGDPWAVHSLFEMLRVYLPEVSISAGAIAAAGILGGRLASRFAGAPLGLEILLAYLSLHLLYVGLSYQAIKSAPVLQTKETLRKMLLASFLFLSVHMVAFGLFVAGR